MAVYFTDNVRDLSNNEGYQFEFVCERCGNGFRSPFVRDKFDQGRDIVRTLGSLVGGRMAQVGSAVGWLDRTTNSRAKDAALKAAVEGIQHHFHQCRGCGDWVCADVCWNDGIGQCLRCSPDVAEELSRAQAAAQVEQLREGTRQQDWTGGLDLGARTPVACPQCAARVTPGKFCSSCGSQLVAETACRSCAEPMPAGARFCSACGASGW